MASTTSENYVTETILVPLYNRSAGLRKLISKKFGTKNFGDSIQFTGIKLDEVRTLISYKVKVYESLIKATGKNPKLSIILNDDEGINVLPDTMGEEDMNVISFKYEWEEERNQYCFWFERDGIALYLPEEFTKSYNNHRNKFKLKNGNLRMEIVSKKDFWTLTTDEIANKIAKQTKEFVKAYDEAELENKK